MVRSSVTSLPLPGDDVVEHFAQAGGDRPHLRPLDPVGQLDRRQPLVDELPGEVDVGAVLERDDHLRQAELRDRAHAAPAAAARRSPARSGKVICCSTSSGPSAGATVLICTWTGVVSGKASMSR